MSTIVLIMIAVQASLKIQSTTPAGLIFNKSPPPFSDKEKFQSKEKSKPFHNFTSKVFLKSYSIIIPYIHKKIKPASAGGEL